MLSVKGYASDDMEHNYRRAKDLSQENSDSVHQFRAIWGLWVFHLVRGQLAKARGLAENLLALANREQNPDLLIELTRVWVRPISSLAGLTKQKPICSPQNPCMIRINTAHMPYATAQDPGITARIILARTLWILGEVEQVEPLALEAIGMARELEHPFTLVFTLASLSWIYSTLRNAKRTLELTDEAIAVSTQYSFELGLAWATSSQGWALAEQGQEEGLGKLLHGLSAIRATGASLNNTFTLALLAEIYLRHNRIDEGLGAIEDAQKLAVTVGRTVLASGTASTERRTAARTIRPISPGSRTVFV